MTIRTHLTGRVFSLVSYGKGSAFLLRHRLSNRSAWLSDDDARAFYDRLFNLAHETSLDTLLHHLWHDHGYSNHSSPDAVAT